MTIPSSSPPGPLACAILLVEDEGDDARLMLRSLAGLPIPVEARHVRTLEEAIEQVRAVEYTAVLLDLHLPDSFGIETVTRMAAHHDTIVVLTGAREDLQMQAIRAGADDFLTKGAPLIEVRRAVACSIERSVRRAARRREAIEAVLGWQRGELW